VIRPNSETSTGGTIVDPLLILLIVVAVIALSGWGYGTYYTRGPVAGEVVAAPGWVSPLGVLGLIAIVGLVAMLVSGWRPFVVVGP
jgi:hypothetical protein